MKFIDCIERASTFIDLKRIANAYVIDYKRLSYDDIKRALIKTAPQYSNFENVKKTWDGIILNENPDIRIVSFLLLIKILLNKNDFTETKEKTIDDVIAIEKDIVNKANEIDQNKLAEKNLFFKYVLEVAWAKDNNVSVDERNLIEAIRVKFDISMERYFEISALIGKFPKKENVIHSGDEIVKVHNYLMSVGLLFTIRDQQKGVDYDVIPEEVACCLRKLYNIEMRCPGYEKLISQKWVKNKSYLQDLINRGNIQITLKNPSLTDLFDICLKKLTPSQILGGFSANDGLSKDVLIAWCKDINVQMHGSKPELIKRIIEYYDSYSPIPLETQDLREKYFQYYVEIANRDYDLLRKQGVISKDLDCEHIFEDGTDYIFEKILGHKPLIMKGSDHPDGMLSYNDKIIMWDNKSKERCVNLQDHISQFDRYIRNESKDVPVFIVIGPDFTEESINVCAKYAANNDTLILLITSQQLKDLAVHWKEFNAKEEKVFPLGYFKQSGRFNDKGIF